jgi:hypothetical protein
LSFAVGLVFGLGLLVGGMTTPSRVVAFLDVSGDFDPSLAMVMIGALAVYLPASRWLTRRGRALDGTHVAPVAAGRVDRDLLLGATIFGIGWGLSGVCPGPAVVGALFGGPGLTVTFAGMLLGSWLLRGRRPAACGDA